MTEPRTPMNEDFVDAYERFDKVRFAVMARKLEVMAVRKNPAAAIEILREYLGDTGRQLATMDSSISNVFPVRLANVLREYGVETLTDADNCTDQEFEEIPNVSVRSVETIRHTIEDIKAGKKFESYGFNSDYLEFEPIDDHEVLVPVSKPKDEPVADNISDAVGILLDTPDSALLEIDDRIEALQQQISRLSAIRKLLGGNAKKKKSSTPKELNREVWQERIDKIYGYLDDNGPARVGVISEAIDESMAMVGRVVKHFDEFKNVDGVVELSNHTAPAA